VIQKKGHNQDDCGTLTTNIWSPHFDMITHYVAEGLITNH